MTTTTTPAQQAVLDALRDGARLTYRPDWTRGSMRMLWRLRAADGTVRTVNPATCWALLHAGLIREAAGRPAAPYVIA